MITINLTDEQFNRLFDNRLDTENVRQGNPEELSLAWSRWDEEPPTKPEEEPHGPCDTIVNVYHGLRDIRHALLKNNKDIASALRIVDEMIDHLDNVMAEEC